LSYSDSGLFLSETNASGPRSGLRLSYAYDGLNRRTNLSVNSQPAAISHAYTYNSASRLTNVSDGTYSASYSFLANSPLISQISYRSNSTSRMSTTRTYDFLNRLLQISSEPNASGEKPIRYEYSYNDANQRTKVTQPDGSYWFYEYDRLGQLVSGTRLWADGTPVAGQQFAYGYDDIGNRTWTKEGGDQNGLGLRLANYSVNSLNQYTNRDVPGKADMIGIARANATVSVNGNADVYRRSEYFWKELTLNNASGFVYQSVTNEAIYSGQTNTVIGHLFLPKNPEAFAHDQDGNLTNDGRWIFTWDAENRLVRLEPASGVPAGAMKRLQFVYDDQNRRVSKVVSNWTGSAWELASERRYLYDGWNVVAELDGSNVLKQSYLWGLDLSGSPQGAGGVGGLLAVKDAQQGVHFVAYDGNGNVCGLARGLDGASSARYDYDPFGRTIRATGTLSATNHFCFSTKCLDAESDFLYYGLRYYSPGTGRWLSRDPIAHVALTDTANARSSKPSEHNPHSFLRNDALNHYDALGLLCRPTCGPDVTTALMRTLDQLKTKWSTLNPSDRITHCGEFRNPANGWDITTLHTGNYSPPGSSIGSLCGNNFGDPNSSCLKSVWVDGGCHYRGSVNYVLYGLMFKLCGFRQDLGWADISAYKLYTAGANLHAAIQWYDAGYDLWPLATTPAPDRPECFQCIIGDRHAETPWSTFGVRVGSFTMATTE
jgi:RHS repeat-associated protein